MCAQYSPLLEGIYADLAPWAGRGINRSLVDASIQGNVRTPGHASLAFAIARGKLYIVDRTLSEARADGPFTFMLTYVYALRHLVQRYGAILPDVEFVVTQDDFRREPVWEDPIPLFQYCKSADGTAILVPYIHFYTNHYTRARLEASDKAGPWRDKNTTALAGYTCGYSRFRTTGCAATARRDENGVETEHPRRVLDRMLAGNPRFNVGCAYKGIDEWARSRMVVHVDGYACSSKLEAVLSMNVVTLKEDSGYFSFFHRLLVPYRHYVPFWRHRPQEIYAAMAWVDSHADQAEAIAASAREFARTWLNAQALECHWMFLLREYGRLLTFDVAAGVPAGGGAAPNGHVYTDVDRFLADVHAHPEDRAHWGHTSNIERT